MKKQTEKFKRSETYNKNATFFRIDVQYSAFPRLSRFIYR